MVYYRKYRPQTISELDLAEVRVKLENILKAKDLPHAFLFTGPKGLGKTSAARILAKAINCERRNKESGIKNQGEKTKTKNQKSSISNHQSESVEPCNKCEACRSITNGSNLDVLEIDAASNRGIDEIRDLREKIKFAPSSLEKKVYIIDEVHMLTTDAFNALLKTLEEPPSHAVFVLCTTEEEKIPPTISSRTFRISFKKPTKEEILRSLKRIVAGEKIDIEEDVLIEIYKLSEGSFRDAAKILEELSISSNGNPPSHKASAGQGKITKETIERTFKTAGLDSQISKLLTALAEKELGTSIKIIDELSQKGADFKVLTERLAEAIHTMLMASSGLATQDFDIPKLQTSELKRLLDMVNKSYRDIKFSVLPQIPLELVVVEWCLTEQVQSLKFSFDPERRREGKVQNEDRDEKKDKEVRVETKKAEGSTGEKKHGDLFRENALSEDFFQALIANVKRDNHSIAGILRGCRLLEISGDNVCFETKYKFHRDKLSEAKTASILDRRASEILHGKVHVVVNLVEK